MLLLAGIFFVIAVIAGIFGFKKNSRKGKQISKIFFFIFLVLFIVALVFGLLQRYFHPDVNVNLRMPALDNLQLPGR